MIFSAMDDFCKRRSIIDGEEKEIVSGFCLYTFPGSKNLTKCGSRKVRIRSPPLMDDGFT
jgi:hypothetical protein